MTNEDVLEKFVADVCRYDHLGPDANSVPISIGSMRAAVYRIATLEAEVRELRTKLRQSEGLQMGALRLKRVRDLRLQAIRDAVSQKKGDDLVRREIEWLLDCDGSELDGYAALSSRGEDAGA